MSSQVNQDAFRSIFPKYCDLLAQGPAAGNESIETFLREQLPRKVELVRSMEGCFNAFLTHFTTAILKRPQHSHLLHSLTLKAADKVEKYFQQLSLLVQRGDPTHLRDRLAQVDLQQLRRQFKGRLEGLQSLLKEKYFAGLPERDCEEEIAMRLYVLLEFFHFLKGDPVAVAGKFRLRQQEVLYAVSKNEQPSDLAELLVLDNGFLPQLQDTVQKRCRPFSGKRDLLEGKVREALREGESRVQPNLSLLVEALLSKERVRVGRQLGNALGRELRDIPDCQGESQARELSGEAEGLKREFAALKNTPYYLDIMRGSFSEKYKMEVGRLENVFYLTNLEKFLQDVSTFLEKVLSLEERVIRNRRDYMRDFGTAVEIKIGDLVDSYSKSDSPSLSDLIASQFDLLESALYGVVTKPIPVSSFPERDRGREDDRRRLLEQRAQEQRERREADKAKVEQRRRKDEERMQQARYEREEKERQRREENERSEIERKAELQRKREEKTRKDEQLRRQKQQQLSKKEELDRAKRDELTRKRQEDEDRKREEQKRREDEKKKILDREEEEKRRKEAGLNQRRKQEEEDRVRREKQRKTEEERLKREKQQRDAEQKRRDEERLRSDKDKKEREIRQAEQRKREEDRLKREKEQREREQKQADERRKQEEKAKAEKEKKDRETKEADERNQRESERKQREAEERRKQEQRVRTEKERKDRERKAEEDKATREKDQKLRREQQQKQKVEKQKKEREEKQRKQREEKERRDREERDRKQIEDRQRRQKEQKQRKDKVERQKRERQDKEKREREQKQRRDREQRDIKEKEQRQRRQREEKQRKQREERDRKQREEKQRKQREQRERKEKVEREKKQRQDKQRKERQQKAQRERKLRQQRELQEKKQREQEQRIRKEQEQRLRKQQEAKKNAASKKPDPKKSSGINYGEFDDDELVEDDMEEISRAGKSKPPAEDAEEYIDDFDDQSPQKAEVPAKELIGPNDIKCLNDYMKGTSYARKNKVNAQSLNKGSMYLQLLEEFVQNKKMFILDGALAKAVMDLGEEFMNPDAEEDNLKMSVETIHDEILRQYEETFPEEPLDMAIRFVLPFPFKNQLHLRLLEFMPAHSYFRFVFEQQGGPNEEEINQHAEMMIEGMLNVLELEGDPTIETVCVNQESRLVLETFERDMPCLLLLFALHYEQADPQNILINQYTIERFFYTAHPIDAFYEAIKEEELITDFYSRLAEKYAANDKIQTHSIVVSSSDEQYQEKLAHSALAIKQQFLKTKHQSFLACFSIEIQDQNGEVEERISVYLALDRVSPRPTASYILICKDAAEQENAGIVLECMQAQGDDDYEVSLYTDFTRHNCLSMYSDWSLPLWAHSIVKRKLNTLQAIRALTFAMTPYYLAFKEMD